MTLQLGQIVSWGETWLILSFLVFVRVGAAVALFPAFGERMVPARVRLAVAFGFTLVILPVVGVTVQSAIQGMTMPGTIAFTEVIIGLGIGAVVRFLVLALQMAGSIAAQSTSLSQIFGGQNADPQPAMGHVLFLGGLALAVTLGLHIRLAEMLILSYEILLPGQLPGGELFSAWGMRAVARAFGLAFTLAAPFVIASLIYNVALGAINRAMPQLMVAFVGAPAITAGGLVLLVLTAPILLAVWHESLTAFLIVPFGGE